MSDIRLSADSQAYIESRVSDGGFADASDYLEALIQEDQKTRNELQGIVDKRREELEQLVIDGLNSGDPVDVDAKFWDRLNRRLNEKVRGSN